MSIGLVLAAGHAMRGKGKVRNVPIGATWVQCLGYINTQCTSESRRIHEARST